jgi:hypothetical protein
VVIWRNWHISTGDFSTAAYDGMTRRHILSSTPGPSAIIEAEPG